MHNNRTITITAGSSRKSIKWIPQTLLWSELVAKIGMPVRSAETLTEYFSYTKARQDDLKDVGGFVGGSLKGERRVAGSVLSRDVVTLDLDSIPAGLTGDILRRIDSLGFGYCSYSTRKHCEAAPRLRILIPLNRACSADEYEPAARKLAEYIGLEMCDPSTFEATRLMYWPSCSSDSQYVYTYADKPFVDVDGILSLYSDWRNVSEWKGLTAPKIPAAAKQADPTAKSGVVGAFCKTYDIYRVLNELLPDVYIPCSDGRYTFAGGSTTGGAVVYENGAFLYSHHATDPAGGKLCNSFDLMRHHLYSGLDGEAKPDTPANKLPSYVKMCEYALADKTVAGVMLTERLRTAQDDFAATAEDVEWATRLKATVKGFPDKTVDNILIILENDPALKSKFALELFSNRAICAGALPWNANAQSRMWSDDDDAGLRWYLEKTYFITGKEKVFDGLAVHCRNRAYNELVNCLEQLPAWDGLKRIDTLLTDYLGAEPNEYTSAVMRKFLIAAIARVMAPGVKYDTMPVLGGKTGLGKSTFIRLLGMSWFNESLSLSNTDKKDTIEMLQGYWIFEISELKGLTRAEVESVKQFISRTTDVFREPYGRRPQKCPRRCVFMGTTNNNEYLRDTTGNRRFLPVDCGVLPPVKSVFNELADEVPQIWAEALLYWRMGESLHLTGDAERMANAQQDAHMEEDVKEGVIREFVEREVPPDWSKRSIAQRRMYWSGEFRNGNGSGVETVKREKVCALEIWVEALGGEMKNCTRKDSIEINAVLNKMPEWCVSGKAIRVGGEYGPQKGFIRIL